ncbi:hypothetical protein [Agromyces sp. Leaf222]|uniref:hypothetical protein n=1 Tax=Agromyces sp. Leaf222 TaxID=1735688 RepID=UPI0012FA8ECE|nr:hypothetical protein [Agromyces sp. Leaf222]
MGIWHVYLGDAPDDYVASLQVPHGTTLYRRFPAWFLAATVGMMRSGRSAFVSNPGEISSTRVEFLWGVVTSCLIIVGRIFGNPGYRTGIGSRDKTRPLSLGHEIATKMAAKSVWRDAASRELFGRGDVAPDWAFALSRWPASGERRYVVMSYRFDKPVPSAEVLQAVGAWAARKGKELVVVTQVARDFEANRNLAKQLDIRHIGTENASLIDVERVVRGTYAEASIVLGNRIHGLILGAVDGAIPAIILGHPDLKVGRTLRTAGLELQEGLGEIGPDDVDAYLDYIEDHRNDSEDGVQCAGERLRRLSLEIGNALG